MATFLATVTAVKATSHAAVTTKTAANSISPADTGGSLENLADLFTLLGWNGDMSTIIYTAYNLLIGSSVGANSTVQPTNLAVNQVATPIAELLNNTSSGQLKLKDGTSAFYSIMNGVPFTGSLTANRNLYPPDESGTIVTHVTKDTIEVNNGTSHITQMKLAEFRIQDPTNNLAGLYNNGSPRLYFYENASAFYWNLQMPTGLTASQTITPLDATGSNPVIVASGRLTGRTAAVATVASYAVPHDGTFQIDCNVLITIVGTNAFKVVVDYTDEGGTARSMIMSLNNLTGILVPNTAFADGNIPYAGMTTTIRAGALSTVVVKTIGTFTGCTYNVEARITQISNV